MTDKRRAPIFDPIAPPAVDTSGFEPRPEPPRRHPDLVAVRRISEASAFPSRQSPDRPLRRRRTGRNIQLNIKVSQATADELYRLADEQDWVLGETLEYALEALRAKLAAGG